MRICSIDLARETPDWPFYPRRRVKMAKIFAIFRKGTRGKSPIRRSASDVVQNSITRKAPYGTRIPGLLPREVKCPRLVTP